jgi:hypothetical protein
MLDAVTLSQLEGSLSIMIKTVPISSKAKPLKPAIYLITRINFSSDFRSLQSLQVIVFTEVVSNIFSLHPPIKSKPLYKYIVYTMYKA